MFSKRTSWHREHNALAELYERLRDEGRSIIDLTASNPTNSGISYPSEKIFSALSRPASLEYHPDPRGIVSARESVCEYYRGRSVSCEPSDIILTASTSEAYSLLFRLLCDANDTVLVPTPSYPLFEYLAQISDVRLAQYHLRYDGLWHIDLPSLRSSVAPDTRAIILINPHNPTGMFAKEPDVEAITDLCRKRNLALIVDEVFIDYPFDGSQRRSLAGQTEALTFVLNGLSKIAGLPQMKLGWIAASGPGHLKAESLGRLEILADTFLSVNTPVQVALPEILRLAPEISFAIRTRVKRNYASLASFFGKGSPCTVLRSEGGWYGIIRVPRTRSEEEWALLLLREHGAYLYPGYFFDMTPEGFLVVSLLPQEELFQRGIRAVLNAVTAKS